MNKVKGNTEQIDKPRDGEIVSDVSLMKSNLQQPGVSER